MNVKRLFIAATVAVISFAAYAVLAPVVRKVDTPSESGICCSNIKALSISLECYVLAKGRFPDSRRWVLKLKRYYAGTSEAKHFEECLKCPEDKTQSDCSYVMNPDLSGKRLSDFPDKYP